MCSCGLVLLLSLNTFMWYMRCTLFNGILFNLFALNGMFIPVRRICTVIVLLFCVIIIFPFRMMQYMWKPKLYPIRFNGIPHKDLFDRGTAHLLHVLTLSIQTIYEIYNYISRYVVDSNIPCKSYKFMNWALTNYSNPLKVVVLKTKQDIINLINESKRSGYTKRVRVMNYSHSYSPLFCDDDGHQYLFGKLLPDKFTSLQPQQIKQKYNKNLTKTWVKGYPLMFVHLDLNKSRITVGGATPILMYYNLIEQRVQNKLYIFPSEFANVIQIHQSFVGTHCIPCHGAGIHTTNLPKYVTRIKMINYEGKEVEYKGEILKKMAAHFGLLGIVTEMEIQMKPSYYGLFRPYLVDFEKYLSDSDQNKFQNDVVNNDYNEVFWCPLSTKIVVYHFKQITDSTNVEILPYSYRIREWHRLQTAVYQLILKCVLFKYNQFFSKLFVSFAAKNFFKKLCQKNKTVKLPSTHALHFSYFIQGQRTLSMEWCFPLCTITKNNQKIPDCTLAQKLFCAAKNLLENEYHSKGIYPQTAPLEMRIIKGCDVNLCFSKDLEFVCCIEVVSHVYGEIFDEYCQTLTNVWIDIVCNDNPENLKYCRPHWGKYWQKLKVKENDILSHIKMCYQQDLNDFNQFRKKADPHNIFLNQTFQFLFANNNNM
eukprot:12689_1